ncbi:alpha/beta hydrolase [Hymenobacter sp. GOD-10R]|uniref:alpha/beta fold hydrolase n=1 Tax=Hymenobacter sp. GOD-10R TaxID=3093922 RepID=UPI002D78C314|nr:alpha/beta hydrolase [Hymenobacter sp. GOD-10R]WRQ27091.1 alpha/beta hydrolase [Hymenobacter sp. GOD-10R]
MPFVYSTRPTPPAPVAVRGSLTERHHVLRRNHVQVLGAGAGKPTLLLCHGFGCNQHIWGYLVPALVTRYQLVLFDHVGAGESDAQAYDPQKYATLDGYARDVVEICQALELRQVIGMGHSVGAMITMLAAVQAPAYFAKLIMLAPSPCYLNEPDYYGGFEREDVQQLLELMRTDYHGWASMFAGLLMGPANPAALGEELAQYFCQMNAALAQEFARVTLLADSRAALSQVSVPVLLVQCQQDAVAPAEVGAYLLAHLPHAQLVTLAATGHCPHLSAPLETLAVVEAFLAGKGAERTLTA